MKFTRTSIFIVISSLALIIVLVIQINWIFQTAKIKEDIFNEKANMVLSKTAEALSSDTVTCRQMETCIGRNEIHKTDSLFNNYMNFYDFNINYSFDVKNDKSGVTENKSAFQNNIYKKKLDEEASKNGLELNLFLPGKKQFIIAEMGTMFITSVILILIVLIMFWRTILLLIKEKRISEHMADFLNNMTHEFKTPLTNIALAGKMIVRDSPDIHIEKIKHYSGIILEENEKLRLQVDQVLSMTALERGEIPLTKASINFHELISDAVKYIIIQVENKNGTLMLKLNADNSVVSGDKIHLINALRNLIDNAIKYSKRNPEIEINTFNRNNYLIICISDKGIGIDNQYHKKIFDKYFRVPKGDVHDVKGFGLGLAYVRKIIELHAGSIEVESQKDTGTAFTITLPNV